MDEGRPEVLVAGLEATEVPCIGPAAAELVLNRLAVVQVLELHPAEDVPALFDLGALDREPRDECRGGRPKQTKADWKRMVKRGRA